MTDERQEMTPAQTRTLIWSGVLWLGGLVLWLGGWIVLEAKTLADKIPDNHITAAIKAAMGSEGIRGVIVGLVILAVLILGWLGGHLFW